jgi:rhomboid protease GluP
MCPHCRAFITTDDKVCPYCDTPVGPRAVDLRGAGDMIAGIIPSAQFVTMMILTINVALFLITVLASMKAGLGGLFGLDVVTLTRFGAARPDAIAAGQWWRLLTAGFLHGGLMHILFNSWAMMDISAHAEQVYGPRRLIAIYLLSTIGGFYASMVWNRGVSVGASAGLFGLIGAMLAVGVFEKTFEASLIKAFYIRWAVYGLLWGLLPFFRVDNAAHIGGLVTGFLAAWLAGTPRLVRTWRDSVWDFVSGILVMLTAISFWKMYAFLRATSRMIGG